MYREIDKNLKYPQNFINSVLDDVETELNEETLTERLMYVLDNKDFSEREKDVIIERFINLKTIKELQEKYGLTRERVRVVQARGLEKLRKVSIKNYLLNGDFSVDLTNCDVERLKISELNVSDRAIVSLKRGGIIYVTQFKNYKKSELLKLKGFGRSCYDEIEKALSGIVVGNEIKEIEKDFRLVMQKYNLCKKEALNVLSGMKE